MMAPLIKHLPGQDFTVVATPLAYKVEYVVYAIECRKEDGTPCWHKAGANTWPDPVDSLELAEPYLHGEVKWDGCSNWHFDEQDRMMLHGCSREDLVRLGQVMATCWDWTRELLPNFDGDDGAQSS